MVFFFENGRLGNQLFQLSGLKKQFPNEKLVLFGFESLFKLIDNDNQCLRPPLFFKKKAIVSIIVRFLKVFSKLRLISNSWEEDSFIYYRKGLIDKIIYFSSGFFQNGNATINLNLKPEILENANSFIDQLKINDCTKVFIHIRRGDYIKWPSSEYPAVLSINWYESAIDHFNSIFTNCFFIVCTDDVPYCQDFIKERKNFAIVAKDQFTELCIMSQCEHGILSASSFSLGAAFLLKRKKSSAIFIGPKYWFGHKEKIWRPLNLFFDWILYI